jgi:hypothetical protein
MQGPRACFGSDGSIFSQKLAAIPVLLCFLLTVNCNFDHQSKMVFCAISRSFFSEIPLEILMLF